MNVVTACVLQSICTWLLSRIILLTRDIRGSSRDCALFMLLERYHIVVKELRFPFPKGMIKGS